MSSRGIRRSISTGIATCASRDAWTEAARSSTGSAGPLDSLLLPFRKRGPLQFWDSVLIRDKTIATLVELLEQKFHGRLSSAEHVEQSNIFEISGFRPKRRTSTRAPFHASRCE